MKLSLVLAALLLAGCAKRYQVCVSFHDGYGCMKNTLARKDAISVGKAISALGMDVVVKPKDKQIPEADPPVVQPEAGTKL